MTRARLRRGARKRREAREVSEHKARRVWAFSVLPLPPELREEPDPCRHAWEEPVEASFSGDGRDVDIIRVCQTCNGFARRCKRCRRFHLASAGRGGAGSMPWRVSREWLQEHGCPRKEFGEVPIPFVWTPDGDGPPEFDLATYEAIEGEPGRYDLQWLS
ncbi:MAG: hypothetical protein F4151_01955 [Gammaproteobacteria bacterium]|nr:hypothetical protein [Gammaproteobacteria bacterium]